MDSLKRDLMRDRPGLTNADTGNFFHLAHFFTAYQRLALEDNLQQLQKQHHRGSAKRGKETGTCHKGTKAGPGAGAESAGGHAGQGEGVGGVRWGPERGLLSWGLV